MLFFLLAAKLIGAGLAVSVCLGVGIPAVFGDLSNGFLVAAYDTLVSDTVPVSVESASTFLNAVTNFFFKSASVFALFLVTLVIIRYFFQSSITDTVVSNVISTYFLSFVFYRVYFGLSIHPLIFVVLTFCYFFWAAKKNAYAFSRLHETRPNLSAFRAAIFLEMSEFNSSLSRYFFIVSGPLFANVIYVMFNIYSQGLIAGFYVTPEMAFSSLYWVEDVCCFMLAFLNGWAYKMLSLS